MQRNTILQGDCVELMRELPDGCIPLTLTSPPYGDLRTFDGHNVWDFHGVARELFRITSPGGVVVWVVQEQIVNGSESGESSRQRLAFMDIGFRLHHTMVMAKLNGYTLPRRYGTALEYAFILSKGRPRYFCPLRDKPNKEPGRVKSRKNRNPDGSFRVTKPTKAHPYGLRSSVWNYPTGRNHTAKERYVSDGHTAPMSEQMAEDHIRSWSRVGDLVFDPFAGAGTTLKMARLNHRSYLGFELNPEYIQLIERRLVEADAVVRECAEAHVGRFGNPKLSA